MIKSIALGLLAGCAVVIVLSSTRSPHVKPILVTTPGSVRIPSSAPVTTSTSLETRLYRIDDLILRIANNQIWIGKRMPTTHPVGEQVWPYSQAEIVDFIIKYIEDAIDSDTWKDNGGSIGSIRELGGMLIVQQTPTALDKIEAFLNELRQRTK